MKIACYCRKKCNEVTLQVFFLPVGALPVIDYVGGASSHYYYQISNNFTSQAIFLARGKTETECTMWNFCTEVAC